jgi:hypothetical protein
MAVALCLVDEAFLVVLHGQWVQTEDSVIVVYIIERESHDGRRWSFMSSEAPSFVNGIAIALLS